MSLEVIDTSEKSNVCMYVSFVIVLFNIFANKVKTKNVASVLLSLLLI